MDAFKGFASAMDKHLEIRRLVAEHHARVEKYKIENAEFLKSEKGQGQLHPGKPNYLDWDYEQSGIQGNEHIVIQGKINGELGS
jgi:hypothetical protein